MFRSHATERKTKASSLLKPHSSTSARAASSLASWSASRTSPPEVACVTHVASSSVTGHVACFPFTRSKRTSTSPAISTPVPQISPSPIAACMSPTANIPPGCRTGKKMRAPRPCRWLSRLPPCRPAHPFVICSPSVATPTTPTIGRAWNEMRSFIRTVSPSTSKTNVTGESTSAMSWPNSGMIVAKPRGPGRTSSSSTTSESPGSAPFTATGPVALFTRAKSIAVTRSSSDAIWPVKQSFVSNVTTAPGSTSSTGSRSGPKPQITSSRETRYCVATAIGRAILLPGRRVMNPTPAGHRRDHLAAGEILVRIRREHDEVCEKAREQLAAAPFVVGQPRGRHAHRLQCLIERHRLLLAPLETAADARQRIKLLDRRVRTVCDDGAALPKRTKAVGAVGAVAPEALDERAVRRRMDELHRRRDAELREAGDVLRREALRVLDAVAQPKRPPYVLRRLERIERVAVGLVP